MINKASQLHDSASYTTLTGLLDTFADISKRMMKEWEGETTIQAGDNLDCRTAKRNESGGVSYHEAHLYNNMIYKSRIDVEHLSDVTPPPPDLQSTDYGQFLLNDNEEGTLLEHMLFHVISSWKQTIFTAAAPPPPPSVTYPDSAKQKTEKVG